MTGDDPLRGTGRTTAKVLHAIANALESPDVWVTLVDHVPFAGGDTVDFAWIAQDIIERIGLEIELRPCPDAVQLKSPISEIRDRKKGSRIH